MFFAGGLAGILLLILWVYCILDVIATDEMLARNMPKMVWLLVVIFVPTVGSVAWLALGRPERAGLRPGENTTRPARRAIGPEDSPEFMLRAAQDVERLRLWEDDLRRREEDLKRREQGDDSL